MLSYYPMEEPIIHIRVGFDIAFATDQLPGIISNILTVISRNILWNIVISDRGDFKAQIAEKCQTN